MKLPDVALDECTLCEICTEICPEIFAMNASGYIEIIESDKYSLEDMLEAVKNCPSDCISYSDS